MTDGNGTASRRFVAKLLFQFRIVENGRSNTMRTCEERMVVFRSADARDALKQAKARGRASRHRYRDDAGRSVHFEFVGVLDLLCLGAECDEDEVWYDIVTRRSPMERAAAILPPERDLTAIARGD